MEALPDLSDAAVAAAYHEHRRLLLGIARRRFRLLPVEAEPLLHDSFVALLRTKSTVTDLRGWLIITMTNACRAYVTDRGPVSEPADFDTWIDPRVADPAAVASRDEILGAVGARLSERDRQILIWHILDGRSAAEVADLLGGLSTAYTHVLIHRCLTRARTVYAALSGGSS